LVAPELDMCMLYASVVSELRPIHVICFGCFRVS